MAVSNSTLSTARSHIDLWMTGPFRAIGLLRRNLAEVGIRAMRRRSRFAVGLVGEASDIIVVWTNR